MVSLGTLGSYSHAWGASADGASVVGTSGGTDAFLWTITDGMLSLRSLLLSAGVPDLQGWTLTGAYGISADGRTIVGGGTNPAGQSEAWVATIGEPPYAIVGDANGDRIVNRLDL